MDFGSFFGCFMVFLTWFPLKSIRDGLVHLAFSPSTHWADVGWDFLPAEPTRRETPLHLSQKFLYINIFRSFYNLLIHSEYWSFSVDSVWCFVSIHLDSVLGVKSTQFTGNVSWVIVYKQFLEYHSQFQKLVAITKKLYSLAFISVK